MGGYLRNAARKPGLQTWMWARLLSGSVQVAGWLLKSAVPPDRLVPGWEPGELRPLDRCLRASYRLALMRPGAPCVLWCSGRDRPGVHALGVLAAPPRPGREGPEVAVTLPLDLRTQGFAKSIPTQGLQSYLPLSRRKERPTRPGEILLVVLL